MTDQTQTSALSHGFHVMLKPVGPICNLDCTYCFYLQKEELYPQNSPKVNTWRMTDETLESFVRQFIEAQPDAPQITFAFQGGEPTLLGIEFFKKALELQKRYIKPNQTILNALQTNGTLLNDEWCVFLRQNNFLVGISIDGPDELHDKLRRDKGGHGSLSRVIRGLQLMQQYQVEHNVLCVVNSLNSRYPNEVYKFFVELGVTHIQFIPIVQPVGLGSVSPHSVRPEQFGRFLSAIFDVWVKRDVGRIFVNMFDITLQAHFGEMPSLCVHAETCGTALAMEHNGDLYSCDHFVEPQYLLGNIKNIPLTVLADSEQQRKFGTDKRDKLPRFCLECNVRFVCNGGCPKDRILKTRDGEPGLNYLCSGFKYFFEHVDAPMKLMADYLRQGKPPALIMQRMQTRR